MLRSIIIGLVTAIVGFNIHAASYQAPLALDQAFIFSISEKTPNQIKAEWKIAPGYYLYRDRLHFSFDPKVTTDIRLPQGHQKLKSDDKFEEVYSGSLTIPITFRASEENVKLKVEYQGCSERGFCYPPIEKTVSLNLNQAKQTPSSYHALQTLLSDQNSIRDLFNAQSVAMMMLIFLGLGLLLAFTPCILPMIPILTSIILGHQQPIKTRKALMLSTTYVLGASLTYAGAGMLAAYLGRSLQVWLQQPWIIVVVSGLFLVLSLSLFGIYDLRIPNYWQNRITAISRQQQGGTYVGVFIMGMISTLIVSPCVTAPLIGVLMYIADSGNPLLGASALFVMSIGMGIPLIVLGTSAGKWMPHRGPWMIVIQKMLGILMVMMAMWLLSRVASWSTILIYSSAIFLTGILYYIFVHRKGSHHPLAYRLGFVSGLLVIFILGGIRIGSVQPIKTSEIAFNHRLQSFKVIRSVNDLDQQLAVAKSLGKPVMVDFYADWCESCVVMDKHVFTQSKVMQQLSPFILLRADLSANNANDEALLKQYEVIAPPTVLFFNNQGSEVVGHRIVGELNAGEFLTRVHTFFTSKCDTQLMC